MSVNPSIAKSAKTEYAYRLGFVSHDHVLQDMM
jgi:hypothetical protein